MDRKGIVDWLIEITQPVNVITLPISLLTVQQSRHCVQASGQCFTTNTT